MSASRLRLSCAVRSTCANVREYVDAYGDGIEDAEMVLLGTVWSRDNCGDVVRPTSEAELLAILADLIELDGADDDN